MALRFIKFKYLKSFALLTAILLMFGCTHTTRNLLDEDEFTCYSTPEVKVGIEMVGDVNQFNYAQTVRNELMKIGIFPQVELTYDLANPDFDYVVRGNFQYSKVDLHSEMYYVLIYALMAPALTGIPIERVEGETVARFDVYKNGILLKKYKVKNVFWQQNGLYTLGSGPTVEEELARATRIFVKEMCDDFFILKNPEEQ